MGAIIITGDINVPTPADVINALAGRRAIPVPAGADATSRRYRHTDTYTAVEAVQSYQPGQAAPEMPKWAKGQEAARDTVLA